jgi:hypothetical protein
MTTCDTQHDSASSALRMFLSIFCLTLALKVILSAIVPLTGDEAYFVLWGQHLDYGYYDHPPMCGWIIHLMLYLGNSPFLLRLPAILFSQFVGLGIYLILRRREPDEAALAATLYLLTPLNVLNVLFTTDTPLFFFAFCAAASFAAAMASRRMTLFCAAGVFLGLAFLSKYFAALLALAFLVQVVIFDRSRRAWTGLIATALASLPFVSVHVVWNYNHSWATLIFNAFSRAEPFDPWNIPILAGTVIYVATPAVIWYLARHWREWRRPFADSANITFATVLVVALASFTAVACAKMIGLHWLLSFATFLFLLLSIWFTADEFRRAIRLTAIFTILHLVVVACVLVVPVSRWRDLPAYPSILEGVRPDLISEVLAPYSDRFILATRSYSRSAILSYHLDTDVIVFGSGSGHGRQFDLLTDFRDFDGRDMLIIETDEGAAKTAEPFFKRIRIVPVRIADVTYHLVLGHEFRYKRYRKKVLAPIIERYYTPPSWLPTGRSPLRDRYFPEGSSQGE